MSSAHPWTDNRVHMREAASTASRYRVVLIAVDSPTTVPTTGVTVVRLPRRRRITRVLLNSPAAVLIALRSRARIVHLHDPELLWAVPILRALGRKVVFDAHEDLPDQFRNRYYVRGVVNQIAGLAGHLAVALASTSDHVIAATSITARRYPQQKTTVVHNFPRLRAEETIPRPLHDRPLRCVYIGAVSESRGALTMRDALLHEAFPSDWHLDVAGPFYPPSIRAEFEAAVSEGRATAHGLLSPEDARQMLLSCRIGLVVLQPTDAYRNAYATKMFEYMAAGLPVIASDFPVWRELLEPFDCATFVDPLDPSSLAAAVARYASDPELARRHGENGRRATLDVFNWNSEERTLLSVYGALGLPPRSGRTS